MIYYQCAFFFLSLLFSTYEYLVFRHKDLLCYIIYLVTFVFRRITSLLRKLIFTRVWADK